MTSTLSSPRRGASLAYRLMLGTAVVALLCFGLTAAISYWQSSSALTASAQATMQNAARYQAEQIGSELGQALTTGKSVATTLLVQRANNSIDRDTAAAVVHDQLQDHPEWVGMGTLWEAQAFDAKDSAFVSAKGHDASGRFLTYWDATASHWCANRSPITTPRAWATGTSSRANLAARPWPNRTTTRSAARPC